MRHRKDHKKLGRTVGHRNALIGNMTTSLLEHKQIKTTTAKAKEIRRAAEKIITFAKRGTLADRRHVLRIIRDKKVVRNLFEEIAPSFKQRNGGYTRVVKLGRRRGDGAEMAILELIGFEGAVLEKSKSRAEEKAKKAAKKAEKEEEAAEE